MHGPGCPRASSALVSVRRGTPVGHLRRAAILALVLGALFSILLLPGSAAADYDRSVRSPADGDSWAIGTTHHVYWDVAYEPS